MGCNNTCTFCIVPHLRGRERDRHPDEVLREVEDVVSKGAREVTLLGQNVNSYGCEFGNRGAFAQLLRSMGQFKSKGLERVRFTSPHPAAFTDDVISAMAETENVMPSLHMPLQSGSDRILRLMRRSYRSGKFLEILEKVRAAIPNPGITTDIIVGFPDETDDDFEQTLEVVRQAQFSSAFTFQYSIRPGTPAATMPNQIPKEVVQERFDRLVEVQNAITLQSQQQLEGQQVKVMISDLVPRKLSAEHPLTGYTPDGRLTHIGYSSENIQLRNSFSQLQPGDIVNVQVMHAAPHHLLGEFVADKPVG
jgi:tRNA-2-methylthio-N6-dimethylallyladenosine synthase